MAIRSLLFACAAWAACAAGAANAQTTTLRIATFLPPRSINVTGILTPYIKKTEKDSGGQIKFQTYWGGALGRNPTKDFDQLKSGISDISQITVSYYADVLPDFTILELPFLANSAYEGSVGSWRLREKGMIKEGLDDVIVLGTWATEAYTIIAKRPVQRIADVKGLKIRAGGAIQSQMLKLMGAAPVFMPVTQVVESLNRGVIDGLMLAWSGVQTFKVGPVAKYHLEAPLGVLPMMLAANKQKWNSLSDGMRAMLLKHAGIELARDSAKAWTGAMDRTKAALSKQPDRHIAKVTGAELAALRKTLQPVHDDWIKRVSNGQAKLDAFEKILADIRAGR